MRQSANQAAMEVCEKFGKKMPLNKGGVQRQKILTKLSRNPVREEKNGG